MPHGRLQAPSEAGGRSQHFPGCVADEAVLGRMRFPNARDAPLVDAKALCSAAPLQWNATVCNSAKLY